MQNSPRVTRSHLREITRRTAYTSRAVMSTDTTLSYPNGKGSALRTKREREDTGRPQIGRGTGRQGNWDLFIKSQNLGEVGDEKRRSNVWTTPSSFKSGKKSWEQVKTLYIWKRRRRSGAEKRGGALRGQKGLGLFGRGLTAERRDLTFLKSHGSKGKRKLLWGVEFSLLRGSLCQF